MYDLCCTLHVFRRRCLRGLCLLLSHHLILTVWQEKRAVAWISAAPPALWLFPWSQNQSSISGPSILLLESSVFIQLGSNPKDV